MPNYTAAIQIRQKKEREAKEKKLKSENENRNKEDCLETGVKRRVSCLTRWW